MSDLSALEMVPTYRIRRDADSSWRASELRRALRLLLRWRYDVELDEDDIQLRGLRVAKRLEQGEIVQAFDLDHLALYLTGMDAYYTARREELVRLADEVAATSKRRVETGGVPLFQPGWHVPMIEAAEQALADVALVRELIRR